LMREGRLPHGAWVLSQIVVIERRKRMPLFQLQGKNPPTGEIERGHRANRLGGVRPNTSKSRSNRRTTNFFKRVESIFWKRGTFDEKSTCRTIGRDCKKIATILPGKAKL